jgi:hypothetical protein
MKAGDLIKMKGPDSQYQWRQGANQGFGLIITGPCRTKNTTRGCTVMWSDPPPRATDGERVYAIPEDWLEVISESR